MATLYWLGRAKNIYDVWTFTVAGTISATETFSITCNGKSITFTATTTTISHVVAGLLALLQADDIPAEFGEMDWTSDAATIITGTSQVAGVSHTFTATDTSAGSITASNATVASGENYVNNVNNWSTGALPVNSDIVHCQRDVPMLYGWSSLSGVTLAEWHIWASYENSAMRLPFENTNGYTEYRERYATMSATILRIGVGEGNGPSGISINVGTVQTACEVLKSQITNNAQEPAIILKGTHASNTLEVQDAEVGVAVFGGETANIDTLKQSAGLLLTGPGCVVENAVLSTCQTKLYGDLLVGTAKPGAIVETHSATTITTLTITNGATVNHKGGTITTADIKGTLDLSGDNTPKTISTATVYAGANIIDPNGILTITDLVKGADVTQLQAA